MTDPIHDPFGYRTPVEIEPRDRYVPRLGERCKCGVPGVSMPHGFRQLPSDGWVSVKQCPVCGQEWEVFHEG